MENPEYTGGWFLNNLATPFSDTIQYGLHEGYDPLYINDWVDAASRANERRQAMRAGKTVDPILPAGWDGRDAKEEIFKAMKVTPDFMKPKTYDMSFRKKYGYYPSYLGSQFTDLAENFPDAMTLATLGSGAIAKKGVGLLSKWLGSELIEEVPPYAAITTAANYAAGDNAPPTPSLGNWGASRNVDFIGQKFGENSPEFAQAKEKANVARTDQYIRDPQTKKFRPETDEEFKESNKAFDANQSRAQKDWSLFKRGLQSK
jgi:predicted AlkP superfamily pyrophosphatase or phosphodiesterase